MRLNRTGEQGSIPPRVNRFFQLENEWYFATREGASLGPYSTLPEAKQGLGDFLAFIELANPKIRQRLFDSLQQQTA